MFRFGPPKFSLGVDIGSSSLKFVYVKKSKEGPQVLKAGIEHFPEGTFVDGVIQDPSAIVQIIKNIKKENGLKFEQVFSAISSQNTILRFLPLPDMEDEELKHAIDGEAEQYVPYPLDTVNLHFAKLARVEQDGVPRILCLLAVAQKDHVSTVVELFKKVGVKQLDSLDIDSLAIINALERYLKRGASFEDAGDEDMEGGDEISAAAGSSGINEDEVTAIVSVGARSTIINVLKGGVLRFSRNVPISGNNITEVIKSVYKVSFEEAEEIKIEKSRQAMEGQEDQEFEDVVQTTVEEIAGEIRRSFDYYKAQHREPVIHRVILTGGTAKLKNIDVLLSNELAVDVEIGDPSHGLMRNLDDEELFEECLQEYTVAIGLALRGMEEAE
jgi:type IV pilus assembly protein PilM